MKRVFTSEQLKDMLLEWKKGIKENENLSLIFHKLHEGGEINLYDLIQNNETEIDITMKVNGVEVDLGMFEKMVNKWFIEKDEQFTKNEKFFNNKVEKEIETRIRDIFDEIEYEGINKIQEAVTEARLKIESIASDINWEARRKKNA